MVLGNIIPNHQSPITSHQSPVTSPQSPTSTFLTMPLGKIPDFR
ncbi:MAG: hypothetical protein ACKPDH_07005 [Sphaerospermopsis kisseleviana]